MTLTADERATLARWSRERSTTGLSYSDTIVPIMRRITADDLRPYRDDLIRFTGIPYNADTHTRTATWHNVDRDLLERPDTIRQYDVGIPNFFAWLEDQTAVPSGDTDATRTIAFWNGLVRTAQWQPYIADLNAFIPQSTFSGWDHNTINCILGLPYSDSMRYETAQNGGWLNDREDATPGSGRIHPYLGEFARAVVNGTYTLIPPTTVTTEETTTVTAVLTPELLATPVYLWPRATREASQHEIARYFFENHIGLSDTIERCLENSNGALLFEDRGGDTWRTMEFGPHTRFRNAVLNGSFITTLTTATPTPEPEPAFAPAPVITPDQFRNYGSVTAEQFEPWQATFRRWVSIVGHDVAALQHGEGDATTHNSVLNVFAQPHRYPTTLPRFAQWLGNQGQIAPDFVPSGDSTAATPTGPAFPFDADGDTLRRLHVDDFAAFSPWAATALAGYRTHADVNQQFAEWMFGIGPRSRYRGEYRNRFVQLARYAALNPERFTTTTAPTTTTPEVTISLPTSPRAAFATEADARAAYNAWRTDRDPRLPFEMCEPPMDPYRRDGYQHGEFWREVSAGWNGDTFVTTPGHYLSAYARGFWRDVQTLGYGTPAFTTPTVTTAEPFPFDESYAYINEHRREILTRYQTQWFAFCRRVNIGQWEPDDRDVPRRDSFQRAMTGEYTGDPFWNSLDLTDDRRNFLDFVDYAREHRDEFPTTTPEATTPTATTTPTTTTPTGTVIPIGPEHPDWHAFAERLAAEATRAGMCPEYDRIARAVGLPTRKERVTYRIVLEVPVDVERGANADVRALREAAATALQTATANGARRLEHTRTQTVG